jgi:hypothetical protein
MSPGLLATRLAGRLVVPVGRDARRSGANVRYPAAAQVEARMPFALDGLPGPRPAGHGRWQGEDAPSARAVSLASSAALLNAPGDSAYPARWRVAAPTSFSTSFSTSTPTSFPTRWGCVPLASLASASVLVSPLRGAARPSGAIRIPTAGNKECRRTGRGLSPPPTAVVFHRGAASGVEGNRFIDLRHGSV